jgi:hypothetical protein
VLDADGRSRACVRNARRVTEAKTFGALVCRYSRRRRSCSDLCPTVATLFRDYVSLAVEAPMERGAVNEEILEIVRRAF